MIIKNSFPNTFQFFGFLLISLALFLIAGGPLIVLQGIAWTGMVQEYSKNDTFTGALQKTFSGKYRCSLCKKIAEETKKQQKTAGILKTDKKFQAPPFATLSHPLCFFSQKNHYFESRTSNYRNITHEPPSPYPRVMVTI